MMAAQIIGYVVAGLIGGLISWTFASATALNRITRLETELAHTTRALGSLLRGIGSILRQDLLAAERDDS
ncbi:MAG: hypothetical protein AB1762_12910 [Gemmatimonadota bacterium]